MAILAGIDEAGLGPILGPLVVSGTVFEVPDELVGRSLWRPLASAVSRKPGRRTGRVMIADSKKVYNPQAGLLELERGVLASAGTMGAEHASLRGLLAWLAPEAGAELAGYPWYASAELTLPRACEAVDVRLRANGLRDAMAKAGIRLAGLRSEVLFEGRFNQLIAATDNKATTSMDQTAKLIWWAWGHRRPGVRMRIDVDRQGGREHYLPALQRLFEAGRFKILIEKPEHSGYAVASDGCELEIHFYEKADDLHLPVALASMTSKYLRELFMALLNAYWAGHVPNLRPTAGYYTDGWRFLQDIDAACQRLNTPRRPAGALPVGRYERRQKPGTRHSSRRASPRSSPARNPLFGCQFGPAHGAASTPPSLLTGPDHVCAHGDSRKSEAPRRNRRPGGTMSPQRKSAPPADCLWADPCLCAQAWSEDFFSKNLVRTGAAHFGKLVLRMEKNPTTSPVSILGSHFRSISGLISVNLGGFFVARLLHARMSKTPSGGVASVPDGITICNSN